MIPVLRRTSRKQSRMESSSDFPLTRGGSDWNAADLEIKVGGILRVGGISLLFGAVLFSIGAYGSFRRSAYTALINGSPSDGSPGWIGLVPWVGIALMAVGVIAVLAVLVILIRALVAPRTYVSYADEGKKLTLSPRPAPGIVQAEQEKQDIVTILNTILQVEYANIVHFPRWASRIRNQAAAEKLRRLGEDSVRHLGAAMALIRQLGGSPSWGFELYRDETDLKRILEGQLEREMLAKWGYQRICELTQEEHLVELCRAGVAEEEEHIRLLQEVLSDLASFEAQG